jgi:hypothetical protein
MKKTVLALATITLLYACTATAPQHETITNFQNGEVLLPDYAHSDTLIVTDAELLNRLMKETDGGGGSDQGIYEVLKKATKPQEAN